MMAADKIQITRTTGKGNKFNRTEAWEKRHDYVPFGSYMGNCHTGRYHDLGCNDINRMNAEHKVLTDNEKGLYRPCGHCRPGMSRFLSLDSFKDSRDDEDIELCNDPGIAGIFAGVKCDCGAKEGIIKMRPHEGGVRLLNHERKKYWIWRECYSCGHQLSLDKAQNKRKNRRGDLNESP